MTETENKDEGKKKLFTQIIRFGFVGGTSFIIDYLITLGVSVICRKAGMDVAKAAATATSAATVVQGGVQGLCLSDDVEESDCCLSSVVVRGGMSIERDTL